ncbi:FRG domain-containing protein [Streptomyces sp. PLK6-54]|uniref:FRG domain-containing protein n=1 Tax=Actinacidiphila acidipaludis TaxID=2873382 RepID=A0ABS7Q4N3_9ACTN|nr:FRG domain-containing protein [Streptomyces acidipaludis]
MRGLIDAWNITGEKSLWFRGHSDFTWGLTPGLHRWPKGAYHERELVRDFAIHSPRFLDHAPASGLGRLAVMQHYGMPTRLLDWTESYLVALWFAVEGPGHGGDAALWAMRPAYLNRETLGEHSIPPEGDSRLRDHVLPDPETRIRTVRASRPAAFRPVRTSARIVAQRGTFTVHGADQRPLDVILEELHGTATKGMQAAKLRIPADSRHEILTELRFAGITDSTVFPELSGISREIFRRYVG